MYVGLAGSYAGRVGINTTAPSYNLHVEGNAYIASGIQSGGNLSFSSANPYLYTGGSYIHIPGGAYFNSGIVYFEAQAQFRGGIHNDSGSYLTLYGGTSGYTNVASAGLIVSGGTTTNTLSASSWISATGSISGGSISSSGSLSAGGVVYAYSNMVVSGAASFGGGYTALTGDIGTSRSDGTGVIYLGRVNNRYVFYSGSYYEMPGVPLYVNGTYYASDERLKNNITSLKNNNGLDLINNLRPVSYTWKDASWDQATQYGFVAQEVQKLIPDLVSVKKDGMLNLNYEGLLAPMVKAIQEQQIQIKEQEKQNELQNERIDELVKKINELEDTK